MLYNPTYSAKIEDLSDSELMTIAMNVSLTTLKHYGVLGMKWGVRKDRGASLQQTRQQVLEARYSKELSAADAKKKASRRVKLERAAIIGGAVLGAVGLAAAAYGGSKFLSREMSPINIAKNTSLQNVNMYGNKLDLERRVFATFKKRDNKTYATKFVDELMTRPVGTLKAYKTELRTKVDLSAPSRRKAERYFQEFKDFKKRVDGVDLGKMTYTNFHRGLSIGDQKADPEFFRFMRNRGYNALQDALDQNGQYKTDSPLLIFNGAQSVVNAGSTLIRER